MVTDNAHYVKKWKKYKRTQNETVKEKGVEKPHQLLQTSNCPHAQQNNSEDGEIPASTAAADEDGEQHPEE